MEATKARGRWPPAFSPRTRVRDPMAGPVEGRPKMLDPGAHYPQEGGASLGLCLRSGNLQGTHSLRNPQHGVGGEGHGEGGYAVSLFLRRSERRGLCVPSHVTSFLYLLFSPTSGAGKPVCPPRASRFLCPIRGAARDAAWSFPAVRRVLFPSHPWCRLWAYRVLEQEDESSSLKKRSLGGSGTDFKILHSLSAEGAKAGS